MAPIARLASVATAAVGIAMTPYILYGPTYVRCSFGTIGQTGVGQPVVTLEPAACENLSLVATQPVWPLPLLALLFWSLVPLIAVAGAWRGRPGLALVALLLEMTSLISFGVGGLYMLYVAVPLAVTWLLCRIAYRAAPSPAR